MKKTFFTLIVLFTFNILAGQGRLYTGVINLRNNNPDLNNGNHYYGYTIGLEGKLSDGFAPTFGAKFASLELEPSEKINLFADKDNALRIITLSGGFTFPVFQTKNDAFRIDCSFLGTLTNFLDHDYDRMKEIHGSYIADVLFGAGGELSVTYKSIFVAFEAERQFSNAFETIEDSHFNAYNIKLGLSF